MTDGVDAGPAVGGALAAPALELFVLGEDGSREPITAPPARSLTIGREGSDVEIDDPLLSRRHARLTRDGDALVVEDLASANGTHLERGQDLIAVDGRAVLHPGDVLRVGAQRLAVDVPARRDEDRPWEQAVEAKTVVAGFANFFAGFMVWALVPVFAKSMATEIGADPAGLTPLLLAAVPVFSGAASRMVFGVWTDIRGPFLPGTVSLLVAAVPLLALWLAGDRAAVVWPAVAILGVGLAALPISIPMGAQRTAPHQRGFALGVISAGSVGVGTAAIGGPLLAEAIGWRETCAVAVVPLAVSTAVFAWGSRGHWSSPTASERARLVADPGLWYVSVLYGITFGGFAALYSFLPVPLQEGEFALDPREAALVVAMGALFGSAVRPLGGVLADRSGTITVLPYIYGATTLLLLVAANAPVAGGIVLLVATMTVLDLGTGSVFKLATQRFGTALGTGAGLVGSLGGFAGFLIFLLMLVVYRAAGEIALALACVVAITAAATVGMVIAARLRPSAIRRYVPPRAPRLELLDSYGRPAEGWSVGEELTIGRSPAQQVFLPLDDLVSRSHARLESSADGIVLEDLGSTNGTHVWADERWTQVARQRLRDGDVVVVGATVFRFSANGS